MSEKTKFSPSDINRLFPVAKITEYQNGVCEVGRVSNLPPPIGTSRGERKKITELTSRARSHLAFVVAATSVKFRSIMTLTYGALYPQDGNIFKSHLNSMLTWLRCNYPNFSYVWIMEYQARGAPHYHLLLSLEAPKEEHERRTVSNAWRSTIDPRKWCPDIEDKTELVERSNRGVYKVHKHKKTWEGLKSEEGAIRYVVKYCLKTRQKDVPPHITNVGRFYGMSRDVKKGIEKKATLELGEDELRLILTTYNHKTQRWEVLPKYVFGLTLDLGDMET